MVKPLGPGLRWVRIQATAHPTLPLYESLLIPPLGLPFSEKLRDGVPAVLPPPAPRLGVCVRDT